MKVADEWFYIGLPYLSKMATSKPLPTEPPPRVETSQLTGQYQVKLLGCWDLRQIAATEKPYQTVVKLAKQTNCYWDLSAITKLDSSTALMLWQAWGEKLPNNLTIIPAHQALFNRWQNTKPSDSINKPGGLGVWLQYITEQVQSIAGQMLNATSLFGQLLLDGMYLCRHPLDIPWADISNTLYDAGVKALGITALVGFLIGIVLSYLSALQLKMFGAEIYIIDILGISIIRELGPLLAAILVAGRSGSAMTAQIGIMRVTEELDALSAMGISHSLRLILPKVVALAVAMPLLDIWTNAAALAGGMLSAKQSLDIGFEQFFLKLPDTVPLVNLFIGLGKSA
jgi:phospholipid/cholesterol/gamma-HCH transport system permease protein